MAHLRLKYVSRLSFLVVVPIVLLLLLSCLGLAQAPISAQQSTVEKGPGIEIASVVLYEIFPVFYKYYDNHPLGMVTLISKEKTTIKNIRLSFFVKHYMDSPKQCTALAEPGPGERKNVDIFALFTDRVLGVTEATNVAADIVLGYRMNGQNYSYVTAVTLRLLNRNSMTLADNRRLAVFVTAKDPAIMSFSRNVMGDIRDKSPEAINAKFLTAMGVFSALDLFGVAYVSAPKPTFAERTSNTDAVVFLQFPRQTLEYKAGDYADLSILYSALLESVGVETAFITVPGHISMAFSLGLKPDEARGLFTHVDNLIFRGDKSWVPVEVTQISGGFLKAWELGAKEWRENAARNQVGFYPLREAWQEYEPVQLTGGVEMTLPGRDAIVNAFLQQVEQLVGREITP